MIKARLSSRLTISRNRYLKAFSSQPCTFVPGTENHGRCRSITPNFINISGPVNCSIFGIMTCKFIYLFNSICTPDKCTVSTFMGNDNDSYNSRFGAHKNCKSTFLRTQSYITLGLLEIKPLPGRWSSRELGATRVEFARHLLMMIRELIELPLADIKLLF